MRIGRMLRWGWIVLVLAATCVPAAAKDTSLGGVPGDTRAWGDKVVKNLAEGKFDEAHRLMKSAAPEKDHPTIEFIIGQMSAEWKGKGAVYLIDLVNEKMRGTSVIVATYFVRLERSEGFVQFRYYRSAGGWEFRNFQFENNYTKVKWN